MEHGSYLASVAGSDDASRAAEGEMGISGGYSVDESAMALASQTFRKIRGGGHYKRWGVGLGEF